MRGWCCCWVLSCTGACGTFCDAPIPRVVLDAVELVRCRTACCRTSRCCTDAVERHVVVLMLPNCTLECLRMNAGIPLSPPTISRAISSSNLSVLRHWPSRPHISPISPSCFSFGRTNLQLGSAFWIPRGTFVRPNNHLADFEELLCGQTATGQGLDSAGRRKGRNVRPDCYPDCYGAGLGSE